MNILKYLLFLVPYYMMWAILLMLPVGLISLLVQYGTVTLIGEQYGNCRYNILPNDAGMVLPYSPISIYRCYGK